MFPKELETLIFSKLTTIDSFETESRTEFKNPEELDKLKIAVQSYALKQFAFDINELVRQSLQESFPQLDILELEFNPTEVVEVPFTWPKDYIYSLFADQKIRLTYLQKTIYEDTDYDFKSLDNLKERVNKPLPDSYFEKLVKDRLLISQKVLQVYKSFYSNIEVFQTRVRNMFDLILSEKKNTIFEKEEVVVQLVLRNQMRGDFSMKVGARGQFVEIPFSMNEKNKHVMFVKDIPTLSEKELRKALLTTFVLLENKI